MFKFLVALCCVVLLQHTVSAALSRAKDEKPECYQDQPGCYVKPLGKVLDYGAQETGPGCTRYLCDDAEGTDRDQYYSIATCGTFSCETIPGDMSAPYPECCPTPNPAPGENCVGIA